MGKRVHCLRTIVDHTHFQSSCTTKNVFSLCCILNARELNNNTVCTLLSNYRLCHAKFINSVMKSSNVLLQGIFLNVRHCLLRHCSSNDVTITASRQFFVLHIGRMVSQYIVSSSLFCFTSEEDFDVISAACNTGVSNLLFS